MSKYKPGDADSSKRPRLLVGLGESSVRKNEIFSLKKNIQPWKSMGGSEDEIPPKIGFPIFRGYVSFKMCIDVGFPRRTVEQLRMSETDCEILVMMAICLFTASPKSWKLYIIIWKP